MAAATPQPITDDGHEQLTDHEDRLQNIELLLGGLRGDVRDLGKKIDLILAHLGIPSP